jgi:hypothetical protein
LVFFYFIQRYPASEILLTNQNISIKASRTLWG